MMGVNMIKIHFINEMSKSTEDFVTMAFMS